MAEIFVELDEELLLLRLCRLLQKAAEDAIVRDEIFKVGLSGGSMVRLLTKCLPIIITEWSRWRFFFCDERILPLDNAESTYGLYKANLDGRIPVTENHFIKIDPELSAEEAAKDYIKKMSVYFAPDSLPRFDVLLLGLGSDGHTCSLFPGHKSLDEMSLWVCAINDSPKPPPGRITFSFPVINNAKVCIFIVTGSDKADMVKRILKDKENLPAARVQPTNGSLYWVLDQNAAKFINIEAD